MRDGHKKREIEREGEAGKMIMKERGIERKKEVKNGCKK